MKALAFACLFVVAACANALPGETSAQKLYAIDGAYKAVLEIAVAYKEACEAKPVELQTNCAKVVDGMQKADTRFYSVREGITPGGATPLAVGALEAALNELKAYIIAEAAKGAAS